MIMKMVNFITFIALSAIVIPVMFNGCWVPAELLAKMKADFLFDEIFEDAAQGKVKLTLKPCG